MRVVEDSGGFNWTVTNDPMYLELVDCFIIQRVKSNQFVTNLDGQNVSFQLSAHLIPDELLRDLYHWDRVCAPYFRHNRSNVQLAICVKSSASINIVPKLKLLANNGSWYDLPMNWFGENGTTRDKQFFAATKFIDYLTLQQNYCSNTSITVRCTLSPKVSLLSKIAEFNVSRNICDANVIQAIITSKVINSSAMKKACLEHLAKKSKHNVLTFPGIDQLDEELTAKVLDNV